MLIGVVSDTHGHVPYAREAVAVLERHAVEQVLHCGDIGSTSIIPLFDRWPTHFVFGNVDHDETCLRSMIEVADQTCHGRFGEIELESRRIALIHSDDGRRFQETVASQQYDLVCYGHTHTAEVHRDGKTLVLNPGALYRATPHSLALVDLERMEVRHLELPRHG